jgi:iron complex transport system permease protein
MKKKLAFILLSIFLLISMLASLSVGALTIPLSDILHLLGMPIAASENLALHRFVLLDLRLPRLVTAILVGAGLAACGVCSQGLFRNPLADPSLIGVSSGAALGAVFIIVLGPAVFAASFASISHFILPLAAFAGGLIASLVAFQIASGKGRTDTALLLLAGVAINAICGAGTGLLSFIADDNQLRDLTFWSMGSVAKTSWSQLAVAAPIIIISCFALLFYRRALNCMLMGESVASHIGYNVVVIKRMIIGLTSLVVGTAVAISGVIFFVGLVVPHMMRMLLGSDHQQLLPASMLMGASILLLADVFTRILVAPAELPIGLLMSLLGGPFFLALLIKQRQRLAGV